MMNGGFHGVWRSGQQPANVHISRAMLTRIARYFRPYWRHGLAVLATVAAMSGMGLVPPLLIRAIVDVALPGRDMALLAALAAGMVAAPAVAGLLGVGQTYLNSAISQRVMFDMRNELYVH